MQCVTDFVGAISHECLTPQNQRGQWSPNENTGFAMAACLIVTATVPNADRAAFDRWYADEHLPQAKAAFGAVSAHRGWSDTTPGVHVALYTFVSLDQARAVAAGPRIKALIAEFDRVWQGRVTRTREVVAIAQAL